MTIPEKIHFMKTYVRESFDRMNNGKAAECLVKMCSNHIMNFNDVIQIFNHDLNIEVQYFCFGKYWPIHQSPTPDVWCNNEYNSMDYILLPQMRQGWNSLTNIDEPIFLIHECLQLTNNIKNQRNMPPDIQDLSLEDWTRQLLHANTEIRKHQELHRNACTNLILPCGPAWICKQHQQHACTICPRANGRPTTKHWHVKWFCNVTTQPKMFIFDENNGLVMTLMKSQRKIGLDWK